MRTEIRDEFEAASVMLAGYWQRPLDELPANHRAHAGRICAPIGWDELSPEQRQQCAAQFDLRHDPRREYSTLWELYTLRADVARWQAEAREKDDHGRALAFGDVLTRVDKILSDKDRAEVGAEIQRLRSGDDAARVEVIDETPEERRERLRAEIERLEAENHPAPRKAVAEAEKISTRRLRELVNREPADTPTPTAAKPFPRVPPTR